MVVESAFACSTLASRGSYVRVAHAMEVGIWFMSSMMGRFLVSKVEFCFLEGVSSGSLSRGHEEPHLNSISRGVYRIYGSGPWRLQA